MLRRRQFSPTLAGSLLIALTLFRPDLAFAVPISWAAAVNGNWNDPTKWSPAQVPTNADDVTIGGPGTYTVTLNVDGAVHSLSLGSSTGTQTLSASSHALDFAAASSVNAAGLLDFTSGSLTGSGTLTVSGTALLRSTTVSCALSDQGLVVGRGSATVNGALTTSSGSIFRCEGDPVSGTATVTVANGFTNNGTIELTNSGAGQSATLNVTAGSLVNALGHDLNVLPGAGGGTRTLGAQIDNQGTMTLSAALSLAKASAAHASSGTINVTGANLTVTQSGTTPTFTNSGTINISAGRTLAVNNGTFNHNAGTISGVGGSFTMSGVTANFTASVTTAVTPLDLSSTTVNGPGSLTNAAGQTLNVRTSTLALAVDNRGLLLMHGTSAISGALTTVTGSTMRCEGDGVSGTSTVTVANGFTNNGTIELTNVSAGQGAVLNVTNGTLVNAVGHDLNVLAGTGGGTRSLGAQLDNQGTVTLSVALTLAKSSATHTNSGTLNLTGADFTLTQSGTTPSFSNSGTINIPVGRTFTVSSGSFNYNAGTISGGGLLSLNSLTANFVPSVSTLVTPIDISASTVNGPGTLTNAVGQTLAVRTSTLNLEVDNRGLFVLHGNVALNGAVVTFSGSTLRSEGDGVSGTSTVTVANGFTNNGTIELTNVSAGQGAVLNVTSGSLVNAPGHDLNVLTGIGGGLRTLGAQLDNQGTVTLSVALALSRASAAHLNSGTLNVSGGNLTLTQSGTSPSFTNSNAINIGSGRTLAVTNGTFNHNAGSISGAGGLFTLNNVTANFVASVTTAVTALDITGSTVNGPGTLTNGAGLTLNARSSTFTLEVDNQGLFVLHGTSALNGALVTFAGSTLRSEGDPVSGSATLTVLNGFTNNGTIELTNNSAGQSATLNVTNGSLVNAPGHDLNALVGAGGGGRTLGAQLDNQGTMTLGLALALSRASADHTNSGTLNITGGNLTLTQSGTTPSFTNTGTINIAATRTLAVSNGTFNHNAGTISGVGGFFTLNNVTANFAASVTTAVTPLDFTSSTVNGPGTITNAAGQTMSARSTTFTLAIDNRGVLVLRGTTALNGALTTVAGSTLRSEGDPTSGSATVTVANGFTNNGTIELTNSAAGQNATLNVTSGTLVNASGHDLTALAGTGSGTRTLGAQLDNQGNVTTGILLTINKASAAHTSSGTITLGTANLTVSQSGTTPSFTNTGAIVIPTGRTLAVSGGTFANAPSGVLRGTGTLDVSATAFTNTGAIDPGTSPGILSVTGSVASALPGAIDIEIGGTTAGTTYDRLAVSGALSTDATINVSIINGFVASPGDAFQVLTYGSRTGGLPALTGLDLGGGLSLFPQITGTSLTLVTVGQTWTRLVPSTTPPVRQAHSAVFRASSDRMIVFGGLGNSGPLNDTWVLTNADNQGGTPNWTPLAPTGTPPSARASHSAVYDATNNRMIVFGGDNAAGTPVANAEVWVLTNADGTGGTPAWSQLAPTGTPPSARTGHGAVYDAANNRMIVFGGDSSPPCGTGLNDVWVLTNANGLGGAAAWIHSLPTGGPPSARAHAITTYDPAANRMTVVGGLVPCGATNNEMWVLANANGLAASAWTQFTPTGTPTPPPSPWAFQSGVYDPATDRIVTFGGLVSGVASGTNLSLTDGNGTDPSQFWIDRAATSGPPDPRSLHSAVAASNSRMIVFGGLGTGGRLNDTWVLDQTHGVVVGVPPTPPVFAWPTGFSRPPWPNPGFGGTRFAIAISHPQRVELAVTDVAGRRVAVLYRGALEIGEHSFQWTGATDAGARAAAGLYFLSLQSEDLRQVRKFVLAR